MHLLQSKKSVCINQSSLGLLFIQQLKVRSENTCTSTVVLHQSINQHLCICVRKYYFMTVTPCTKARGRQKTSTRTLHVDQCSKQWENQGLNLYRNNQ